jgi:hypothetical protein
MRLVATGDGPERPEGTQVIAGFAYIRNPDIFSYTRSRIAGRMLPPPSVGKKVVPHTAEPVARCFDLGYFQTMNLALRRIVLVVALLNLTYFGIEFAVALAIGSVSLFADSIDFLEDASVNLLILLALGWSLRSRARVGMALALILLLPGLATVWTAWEKFNMPVPPPPFVEEIDASGAHPGISGRRTLGSAYADLGSRIRHPRGTDGELSGCGPEVSAPL